MAHRYTAHLGYDESGDIQLYVNSPISVSIWGARLERGTGESGKQFPQILRDFYDEDAFSKNPRFCLEVLSAAQGYLDQTFNKDTKTKVNPITVRADKKGGRKK